MRTLKSSMKTAFAMAAMVSLAACGGMPNESATRNAPATLPSAELAQTAQVPFNATFDVQSLRVSVPRSLTVSEANSYYPGGDIVWREDGPGDRHAQVKEIIRDGLARGVANMGKGTVPAIIDIEVTRFHALTEKARYTTGGVHAIQFNMVMRDPATRQAFSEPKFVKANFKAYGGQAAVEAEQKGLTQRVRITKHLAGVIQQELAGPEGYVAQKLGRVASAQ